MMENDQPLWCFSSKCNKVVTKTQLKIDFMYLQGTVEKI